MSPETFTIPVENIAKLDERIAKLNKRAEKIGVEPIKVEKKRTTRESVEVTIEGQAPKLNGWQFIATLEHDEDGTIIRRIPTFSEEIDLSQYRDATPETCDHCGYRRRRNDTYIVANTDMAITTAAGPFIETKQVGSNCLKDFTGHESPQQVAKFLEQVRDLLEEVRGGHYSEGKVIPRYPVVEFLARAAWAARKEGFVSMKAAKATRTSAEPLRSTVDVATRLMTQFADRAPQPQDYKAAEEAIAWAENLTEDQLKSDYLYNLHTVLKNGSLTARQFGIAASGVYAHELRKNR